MKDPYNFRKAYQSLTLFRPGPRGKNVSNTGTSCYSVKFNLQGDISSLFPYIHGEREDSRLYDRPPHIVFHLKDHLCILYPSRGAFTSVLDHAQAVDFFTHLTSYLNDINRRTDIIIPNHRIYKPLSPLDIYSLLPASDCKECGYATCLAFAAALARHYTSIAHCPHIAHPVEEKSSFSVKDPHTGKEKTVSLDLNTQCLHRENHRKQSKIQKLEAQLAEYEQRLFKSRKEANTNLKEPMTKREIEVLEMLTKGWTNRQIAEELFVSVHTIKSHVNHIFDKLGVNDRTQASVWAVTNGYL